MPYETYVTYGEKTLKNVFTDFENACNHIAVLCKTAHPMGVYLRWEMFSVDRHGNMNHVPKWRVFDGVTV